MAADSAGLDDAGATRRGSTRSAEGRSMAGPGPGMAVAAGLEQLCDSCLKPKLKCACKRAKRSDVDARETTDYTPMEGVEDNPTTAGNNTGPPPGLSATSSSSAVPPGLSTASASSAVQPQMVQDPLHTGLAQSVQTARSNDSTIHYQNSHPAATATTAAQNYDPQLRYEEYREDEFSRNACLPSGRSV